MFQKTFTNIYSECQPVSKTPDPGAVTRITPAHLFHYLIFLWLGHWPLFHPHVFGAVEDSAEVIRRPFGVTVPLRL
jgi:hypothetical protein